MQKSFDLEEQFKNNIDNLDDKDEKLHQFLAEPGNTNQKKLSPLDVKRYQENQAQLERERENSQVIPDLISNFTDNNKDFFSDDSRIQNSIAESIDYKYFDHINEDNNNIMKLNKEREIPVKNSSVLEGQKMNKNPNNNNNNNSNKKYSNLNNNRDKFAEENKDYYAERHLENYNSDQFAAAKGYQKDRDMDKDDKHNNIDQQRDQNDYRQQEEDMDFEEYEEEEEYEGDDYEEDYNNRMRMEANSRAKIGPDGNISIKSNTAEENKQKR